MRQSQTQRNQNTSCCVRMAPGRASMTLLHATWPECPPMLWSAVRTQT
uniref:Uncharacterized protein n=1 Tax=Anguilla anguilla TaxID=7936 RepID=A0A0E9QWG0_ANGAN